MLSSISHNNLKITMLIRIRQTNRAIMVQLTANLSSHRTINMNQTLLTADVNVNSINRLDDSHQTINTTHMLNNRHSRSHHIMHLNTMHRIHRIKISLRRTVVRHHSVSQKVTNQGHNSHTNRNITKRIHMNNNKSITIRRMRLSILQTSALLSRLLRRLNNLLRTSSLRRLQVTHNSLNGLYLRQQDDKIMLSIQHSNTTDDLRINRRNILRTLTMKVLADSNHALNRANIHNRTHRSHALRNIKQYNTRMRTIIHMINRQQHNINQQSLRRTVKHSNISSHRNRTQKNHTSSSLRALLRIQIGNLLHRNNLNITKITMLISSQLTRSTTHNVSLNRNRVSTNRLQQPRRNGITNNQRRNTSLRLIINTLTNKQNKQKYQALTLNQTNTKTDQATITTTTATYNRRGTNNASSNRHPNGQNASLRGISPSQV